MIVGKADRECKHPTLDTGGWTRDNRNKPFAWTGLSEIFSCALGWPMQTKRSQRYEPLALGETPNLSSYQDGRT